jgi:hypothetical protein
MALKIEKGGWLVIGLIGVGLVGYSLQKYGFLDFAKPGSSKGSSAGAKVDPAKPLPLPRPTKPTKCACA